MALITCPDCGKEHSDSAEACPECGRPNKPSAPKRPADFGGPPDLNAKKGNPLGGCILTIAGFAGLCGIVALIGILTGVQNTDYLPIQSASKVPIEEDPVEKNWVPSGFQKFDENTAVKWSPPSSYSCSWGRCAQIEVVSRKDCDWLYAEAIKIDNSGNNVGFTNDTTSGLRAGQTAILKFETSGDFKTFEISKINCR